MISRTARATDRDREISFYEKPEFVREPEMRIPESQVLDYIAADNLDSSLPPINYDLLVEGTMALGEKGKMPLFTLKTTYAPSSRFISLQKWEGVVTEVGDDYFVAKLYDLTKKGNEEEAEFALEEISEDELDLVVSGAVFYWNIGYHDSYTGQRIRASMIRFRRLPAWGKREIEASADEADELIKSLGW